MAIVTARPGRLKT